MNKYIYVALFCLSFQLHAQKIKEQTIENNTIKTIVIDDDAIFKIKISTVLENEIFLKSKIDGEYANDISVSAETKNDTLYISTGFQPFYKHENDKLSAHKVVSVEIILSIPENLTVYAKSAIASAEIKGNYNTVMLEFSQGNTNILNFTGNAIVNSVNGNINIHSNDAIVEASSKTGIVEIEPLIKGIHYIKLNSINGNISVIKTKK